MESIGQQLKQARELKKVTPSQAAAATNMKVQHVEALERDDFTKFSVPVYAKGFIKLYADYLKLDPEPLIEQYMDQQVPTKGKKKIAQTTASQKPNPELVCPRILINLTEKIKVLPWRKWWKVYHKPIIIGLGVVVVVVIIGIVVSMRHSSKSRPVAKPVVSKQTEPRSRSGDVDPYLNKPEEPYIKPMD